MENEDKINLFRNMAEADPSNELAHFSLGKLYKEAGRFEEAETMLENRLKRRETPRDMFWLARAQQANGNRDAAEASVNQVRNAWVGADSDSEEIGALTQLASSLQ